MWRLWPLAYNWEAGGSYWTISTPSWDGYKVIIIMTLSSRFFGSGSFTDPGADTWTATVDYGDASGTMVLTLNSDNTFNLNHVYADNGAYTVTVKVTDDNNGIGSDTASVTVNNVAPTVEAGVDQIVNEGTVSFSGTFTDPGTMDTHTIVWDFGDGSTATGSLTPTHTYAIDGVYTVTLTVTDDDGEAGLDSLSVLVDKTPPSIDIIGVTDGNYYNTAVTPIITITDTNPETQSITLNSTTYTSGTKVTDEGSYTLEVSATDKAGNTATQTINFVIDKTYTPKGGDIIIEPVPDVSVTFTEVTGSGFTDVTTNTINPKSDKSGFKFDKTYYDVITTTTYSSPVTVCLSYDDSDMSDGREQVLKIFHWENEDWTDVTSSLDTDNNIICGTVNSLSWFGIAYDITPNVDPITAPIDPITIGTAITSSALFTDPTAMDIHSAVWDWGDETTSTGTVTEDLVSGSITDSHTYTQAGVYTITLTVTNNDGGAGSMVYQYVVVYDPNAGFVTGGGWIDSPEGAYADDPSLTGKATFGFVSKYNKGATIPTGQTEFHFKVADLNFHSDSYEWLVIAGARAQYKGTGTINGSGSYGFMLTAIDEELTPSTNVDLFRIKIWDKENNDAIIYDNQMNAPDDADPTTTIATGSIVIHKQ